MEEESTAAGPALTPISERGCPPGHIVGPSDLHLHSSHSDGTEAPAEVIRTAHSYGVRTVALTDHDGTSGWGEAVESAVEWGMTFIPGIELSSTHMARNVHILGYLVDADNVALREETERIRGDRVARARRMVDNIALDYGLRWEDVVERVHPGATIGRPHIADALVARGIRVPNFRRAGTAVAGETSRRRADVRGRSQAGQLAAMPPCGELTEGRLVI